MAEENQDTSIYYYHNKPESILSEFTKFILKLSGQKKAIERDMIKGSINQDAATVPKSLLKKFLVETEEIFGRNIWTLKPKQNGSDQVILFVHGGAYIYNIFKQHWQFLEQLLNKTGAKIIVPDYPLAPQSNIIEAIAFMHFVYQKILQNHSSEKVSFMGDSAGGGLSIAFAQKLRNERQPMPRQLILLSPWLDITMSNPIISDIDKNDKILSLKGLQLAGKAYAGKLDLKDYRISPIYGNLNDLPRISIFISTYDIFIADARKLKSKLESEGVKFNYYEYPKLMHDWIIITALKESKHSLSQIVELI
jgi:acetyl esterase/lipase